MNEDTLRRRDEPDRPKKANEGDRLCCHSHKMIGQQHMTLSDQWHRTTAITVRSSLTLVGKYQLSS